MRPLTPSEKKLLLAFGAIAAVLATVLLAVYLFDLSQKTHRQLTSLQNQKKQSQLLLAEKNLWQAREAWLQESLLPAPPSGIANATLLTTLQNAARPLNVQILEQRFLQPESDPLVTTAGAELTVSATLKNLVAWLHAIQTPENLTGVTRISIRSDADATKVRAEVRVLRYYRITETNLAGASQ